MAKGSNSSGLRNYNIRVVLSFLRLSGPKSKAELARYSNLTPQAVTRIVDELEEANLIVRSGRRFGEQGQPSTLYALEPKGAYSIGINVGRRNMQILLIDFSGNVLERKTFEYSYPEARFLLNKLVEEVGSMLDGLPAAIHKKITGIGIAMPWFIGAWQEKTGMTQADVTAWDETNFAEEITALTDLPVIFENDCTAAATAELLVGNEKLAKNFLYILVGYFIGGGLVLNGSIENGIHGNAGALSSMPVPKSKLYGETQGSYDLLLNRASIFVLLDYLNDNGVSIKSLEDNRELIDSPPVKALIDNWLADCADALAHAILSAISILDLEIVIVEAFLPRHLATQLVELINLSFKKIAPLEVFVPKVVLGSLGYDAIALGGAMLPFYSTYSPNKTVLLKGGIPRKISI